MPQPPPPPKPEDGIEHAVLPEPVLQLKDEINFLTSLEEHLGHFVLFSDRDMLCSNEKLSLHFKHIYS